MRSVCARVRRNREGCRGSTGERWPRLQRRLWGPEDLGWRQRRWIPGDHQIQKQLCDRRSGNGGGRQLGGGERQEEMTSWGHFSCSGILLGPAL